MATKKVYIILEGGGFNGNRIYSSKRKAIQAFIDICKLHGPVESWIKLFNENDHYLSHDPASGSSWSVQETNLL